jgi:hypothetical protein
MSENLVERGSRGMVKIEIAQELLDLVAGI